MPAWEEAVVLAHGEKRGGKWMCKPGDVAKIAEDEAAAYQGCMLGSGTTWRKTAFRAYCWACLAASTAGSWRRSRWTRSGRTKSMPSCCLRNSPPTTASQTPPMRYALGLKYDKVSIEPAVAALPGAQGSLAGTQPGITEENIQSRVRGTILMAISNKFGGMVVTTGNKSEMSVGYATLYGDMNGGFNPIKDLYKMEVYALSRWRNAHVPEGGLGPKGVVIPERILTKAPTAELRANQRDRMAAALRGTGRYSAMPDRE